jgi:hypothetical protein
MASMSSDRLGGTVRLGRSSTGLHALGYAGDGKLRRSWSRIEQPFAFALRSISSRASVESCCHSWRKDCDSLDRVNDSPETCSGFTVTGTTLVLRLNGGGIYNKRLFDATLSGSCFEKHGDSSQALSKNPEPDVH